MLAPALLAMALLAMALPAIARGEGITLDPHQIADGGVTIARPAPITYTPTRRGYGLVVDAGSPLGLRARIVAASAQLRLAEADAKRSHLLYHGAGNVSEASVQQAAAKQAVARAQLDALRTTARARYGASLGTDLIHGGPVLAGLANGGSLIEVTIPGAPAAAPPRATADDHATLRLIGAAGHVSAGVLGQTLYYSGPALPVGTSLAVALPRGAAQHGVMVPASAVIYQAHGASLYIETAPGRFSAVTIATGDAIRHDGALAGYFIPAGSLPTGAGIVVRGAGLLRSIDRNAAKTAGKKPAGDPDGD